MSDNQLIRHLLGVPISLPLLSAPSFVHLVPYSSIHPTPNAGVGLGSISVVFGQSRGPTQIICASLSGALFWIFDFGFWIEKPRKSSLQSKIGNPKSKIDSGVDSNHQMISFDSFDY